jgi:hypothetical protein
MYLINKIPGNWDDVRRVVKDTLTFVDIPTAMLGEDNVGVSAANLRSMVEWMVETRGDVEFDKNDILSRVRINVKDETIYTHEVELSLSMEDDEERSRKRIRTIISELKFDLDKQKIKRLIAKTNHRINFSVDVIDHKETIKELQSELEKFSASSCGAEKAGFVGRLNTDEESAMAEVFIKAKETNSTEGVMRTGFVGLNRMLGINGFRRGELVNFGALTHNYKTGILNDLARQIPLYNTPWMWDPKKKPMTLRISFENKLEQDLPIIYRSLVEHETGEKLDVSEIDPVKAAKYIKERLGVNGYVFGMECYDPNNFDVYDLIDLLNKYEADGYEIHLLLVDYLELIAKQHGGDRKDEAINDAFEILRNHCFPKGITVVTAHQLSSAAIDIQREGGANFAERVSTGGYYRNTKSLNQKLDVEVIIHIERRGDRSFLTFARGKHRGQDSTPMRHRTFAYEFQPVGGLVDDVEADVPSVIYSLNEYLSEGSGLSLDENVGKNEPEEAW